MRPDPYKSKKSFQYKLSHGLVQSSKAKAQAAKEKAKNSLPSNSYRYEEQNSNNSGREEFEEELLRDDEDEVVGYLLEKLATFSGPHSSLKASSYFMFQEEKDEEWFQDQDQEALALTSNIVKNLIKLHGEDANVPAASTPPASDNVVEVKGRDQIFPFSFADFSDKLSRTVPSHVLSAEKRAEELSLSFSKPIKPKTQVKDEEIEEDGIGEDDGNDPIISSVTSTSKPPISNAPQKELSSSKEISSKKDFEDFLDDL